MKYRYFHCLKKNGEIALYRFDGEKMEYKWLVFSFLPVPTEWREDKLSFKNGKNCIEAFKNVFNEAGEDFYEILEEEAALLI